MSKPSSQKRHKDAVIAPVLVGNQAQHPPFFHRPGTAEDLIGPTGKDFLPDTAAQLIHEITVDRIGLRFFHSTEGKSIKSQGRSEPFPVIHVAGEA